MMTKTLDISKAKSIDGWMTEAELVWLAERAGEHRSIVEIGSHLGRSTRAMLDHTEGIVYAFDDWRGPRDVYLPKEERDGLFDRFLRNMEDTGGKLVIFRGEISTFYWDRASELTGLTKLDMVFIDGSHEYEDVKNDILFWKDKIVSGGLLCGHDIQIVDVYNAALETLRQVEVAKNTTIWWKTL